MCLKISKLSSMQKQRKKNYKLFIFQPPTDVFVKIKKKTAKQFLQRISMATKKVISITNQTKVVILQFLTIRIKMSRKTYRDDYRQLISFVFVRDANHRGAKPFCQSHNQKKKTTTVSRTLPLILFLFFF